MDNERKLDPVILRELLIVLKSSFDKEDDDFICRINPGQSCASSRGNTGRISVILNNWA